MGAPYYKYRQTIDDNNVAVFSSNYQLYGDMSERVMESLKIMMPSLEIYSIDEAFICLLYTSPSPRDLSTSRMPSSA